MPAGITGKNNGQSPLQVALKTSALEIIDYLIKNGAYLSCHAALLQG